MADDVFMQLAPEEFQAFRPNSGVAVVKRDPPETHKGLLVTLPKADNKRRFEPTTGVVLRLGPPEKTKKTDRPIPWGIKPGDRVVLDKYAGHDLRVGGEAGYVLCSEGDVLAVLPERPVPGH